MSPLQPLNLDGLRFHPMPEIDESTAKFLAFLEQAQKRMVDQAAELAASISGLLRDMPPLSNYSNATSTSFAPAQPITDLRFMAANLLPRMKPLAAFVVRPITYHAIQKYLDKDCDMLPVPLFGFGGGIGAVPIIVERSARGMWHTLHQFARRGERVAAVIELGDWNTPRMVDLLNAREFAEEGLLTTVRPRR